MLGLGLDSVRVRVTHRSVLSARNSKRLVMLWLHVPSSVLGLGFGFGLRLDLKVVRVKVSIRVIVIVRVSG